MKLCNSSTVHALQELRKMSFTRSNGHNYLNSFLFGAWSCSK